MLYRCATTAAYHNALLTMWVKCQSEKRQGAKRGHFNSLSLRRFFGGIPQIFQCPVVIFLIWCKGQCPFNDRLGLDLAGLLNLACFKKNVAAQADPVLTCLKGYFALKSLALIGIR